MTQAYDILQQITDPRGTYVVDPDLRSPYTDQYTIASITSGSQHWRSARAISTSAPIDFVGRVRRRQHVRGRDAE